MAEPKCLPRIPVGLCKIPQWPVRLAWPSRVDNSLCNWIQQSHPGWEDVIIVVHRIIFTPIARGGVTMETLGDSIVLDALLNIACCSWCILASRRNVCLNSLSLLGTNRFVIWLQCSEKLSADLQLLSACRFVALQTRQIRVVRQPVFPKSVFSNLWN